MPRPVDKAALQRCFGMLNNPNLSETVLPLRDLTKQDAVLYCLTRMKTLSVRQGNSLHQLLSCTEYYDCSPSPVTLQVDAFLQDNQPVRFTSHSLDAKERNCAQIEKECLAIVTCNNKWHQYLSERAISQFIPTISPQKLSQFKTPLSKAPRRLQRLMLSLQQYRFKVTLQERKRAPR